MVKRRQKQALTELAIERRVADLRLEIQSQVSPFKGDTAAKKMARLERARLDREFFARTYFPHRLTEASPDFHVQLDEAAEQPFSAARVFRGGAKTTRIFNFGVIHAIAFKLEDYVQYYSAAGELAEDKLVQVRTELEINPRLLHDFGYLRGPVWRSDRIVTSTDICVDAFGILEASRGKTDHLGRRPTRIYLDDLDDDEKVESATQRAKVLARVNKAVIPSLHPTRGKITALGTEIHPECFIATVMSDPRYDDWYKVDIAAERMVDGERAATWPQRFPLETLDRIKTIIGLAAYCSEYLNRAIDPETQELSEDDLRWFSDADLRRVDVVATLGALDPSLGKSKRADYQAIIGGRVVRTEAGETELWIDLADLGRQQLGRLIATIFNYHRVWDFTAFGVETVAFQEALKQWAEDVAKRRGVWINFQEIKNSGGDAGKEARIRGTFAFYKAGRIRIHERLKTSEFVMQLLRWPKGHDDGPDAAEMLKRLAARYGGGEGWQPVSSAARRDAVARAITGGYHGTDLGGYWR